MTECDGTLVIEVERQPIVEGTAADGPETRTGAASIRSAKMRAAAALSVQWTMA